jgi:hypothetical protein
MAVENKYVNAGIAAGKAIVDAATNTGGKVTTMVCTFETAAADDDGSVYRLFKGVPSTLVPKRVVFLTDAITSGTDWDFGIYETDLGAVIDKDLLMDGQTFATALTELTGGVGLKDVDAANRTKMLYELNGETAKEHRASYDLCLTANTVGSAAGTITCIADFIIP